MKFQELQQKIIKKIQTSQKEKDEYIPIGFLDDEILPDAAEFEQEKLRKKIFDKEYPLSQKILIYLTSKVIEKEYENSSWYLSLREEEVEKFFTLEKPLMKAVVQFLIENNRYAFQKDFDLDTGKVIERFQIDSRYSRNVWLKSELVPAEAEILLEIGAQMLTPLNTRKKSVEIEESHVTKLILPNQHLKSIPDSIDQFTHLKTLNLQGNQLNSIPYSIGKLTNLESLDLDYNTLLSLPDSIGNLTKLKYLWLRNNNLKIIPESIIKLKELKHLSWDGNLDIKISKRVQKFNDRVMEDKQVIRKPRSREPFIKYSSPKEEKNEYLLKICVVGTPSELKTNLIRQFAEGKFTTNYLPTLGVDITTKKIQVDDSYVKLIIVDAAGQEFFGKLRPSYYRGASGAIIVFESNEEGDISIPLEWIKEFRKHIPNERIPTFFVEVKSENKNQEEDIKTPSSSKLRTFFEDKINKKYYEVWITESNTIINFEKFEETIYDLTRSILNQTLLENVDIANVSSILPNNARKVSLVQYYKEKTIGYCLYNCNTIPKHFIHNYNKYSGTKFVLYPDQHLNQCLGACPLFKLIVDRSEVEKFRQTGILTEEKVLEDEKTT